MSAGILPVRYICRFCYTELRGFQRDGGRLSRPLTRTLHARFQSTSIPLTRNSPQQRLRRNVPSTQARQLPRAPVAQREPLPQSRIPETPSYTLASLVQDAEKIISNQRTIPDEVEVLTLLERFHDYSNYVVFGQLEVPHEVQEAGENAAERSTSSLDFGQNDIEALNVTAPRPRTSRVTTSRETTASTISKLTYDLLCSPTVYMTPPMLDFFVRIHCLLGSPEYIPQIFYLYANKPIPNPKSTPVTYKHSWPTSPKNAIPLRLSSSALDAAMVRKDMSLALAIVETSVALSAYRRHRFISKASMPLLGVIGLPFALNAIANYIAYDVQVAFDPEMSRFITLAACGAYFTMLGTVGFVALTTYNDHHQRVSWQPGFEMRDRWLKEDERAFYDRIALAWGFKERARWGEEQGEDWAVLREYLGVRAMILDRTNLLDDME